MPRETPFFHSTTPSVPPSGSAAAPLELRLVHPPELAGQVLSLRHGVVFGRAPEDEITSIFHTTVLRRHAAIRAGIGGAPCLVDLGSRNGTRVNGARLERAQPLLEQDVVRIGDVLGVVDRTGACEFAAEPALPGQSPCIAELRATLARAARDPAPVLIRGETGTGKERVAREIHARSGRRGSYVTVNAAALPAHLLESELFGHERGAFTGAAGAKQGLLQAAHGGTLFLDEIGELGLEQQSKLLRFLQEGEVRPLGSTRTLNVDVRIVVATNRELAEEAKNGTFRRDLYARLCFWELALPALRKRRQDIMAWTQLLLATWNETRQRRANIEFLPDAAERVLLAAWPENLRGIGRLVHRLAEREVQRAVGLTALTQAMPELARPSEAPAPTQAEVTPRERPDRPDRNEFLAIYEELGCSVRATAKHYGKDRRQIYRWLEQFGVPRARDDEP